MYGVPANRDLSVPSGAELIQVCLGELAVEFHIQPHGDISVTGEWALFDEASNSIDRCVKEGPRPPFQLHRLLGKKIVRITIYAPKYLDLTFGNGDRLRLIDNSEQYES